MRFDVLLRRLVHAALLMLLAGAVPAAQSDDTVGPDDVLAVNVYGQSALSGKFNVDGDGTFTLPMVGRVAAGGQTLRQIEQAITERLLQGFMKHPEVSVS